MDGVGDAPTGASTPTAGSAVSPLSPHDRLSFDANRRESMMEALT